MKRVVFAIVLSLVFLSLISLFAVMVHEQKLMSQQLSILNQKVQSIMEEDRQLQTKQDDLARQVLKYMKHNEPLADETDESSANETAPPYRNMVAKTDYFKLYKPAYNETLSISDGFSFHAEIHESAIGMVDIELVDGSGNILAKTAMNQESYFDDGIFQEWTFFAMRMHMEKVPETNSGELLIRDRLSLMEIKLHVYFD